MKHDFIQTHTGKQFWPFEPKVEDIDIIDIAHSLSNICRYNGHSKNFYSVAEHSILVASALPDHLKLYGLMHDAAEAYFSDIPQPIKKYLSDIEELENCLMEKICLAFDLPNPMPQEVKQADLAIIADEKEQVMAVQIDWYNTNFSHGPLGVKINFLHPRESKILFLKKFVEYNLLK
jgi:5'-deoxynucleotidase YfbR-like HD superfamily hydrolase